MNMKELCQLWLRFKKRSVKKTSLQQYVRIIKCYIDPKLGETEVAQLKLEDVLNFMDDLDTYLSSKSIQDIVVILKSILNYGKLGGYCDFPIKAIPTIRVKKKK